jgi:maltose/moltooligosaccharide transporter
MVVDILASDDDLGTYTGLYYIASQLAAVAGPTINGYIVEWGGGDYNLIFVVTLAFFLLAILCMLGVTRGEAKESVAPDNRCAIDGQVSGGGGVAPAQPPRLVTPMHRSG